MSSDLEKYLEDFEDLTETKDRGILKKVIREGNSEVKPSPDDVVVVHYVGTNYGGDKHGEQFDSSRARGEKFEFKIGKDEVIKAWDVGVATMKIGEICELIAKPEYAYFDDRTMKFEIELFDTKGMDVSSQVDGSVRKSVLEKGRDILSPTVGLVVELGYRLFGETSDFRNVSYVLGDPASYDVPVPVDLAARHMNSGERSLVRVSPSIQVPTGDHQGTELSYEVKMISFEKVHHLSALENFEKQMEYAETLKSKANEFFKVGKFELAISLYKRLDDDLQYIIANGVQQQTILTEIVTAVQLNMALVYLKLSDAAGCSERCRKVLDANPSNEKALFRMGQACLLRKDHEDAARFFRRTVAANPQNRAALHQLRCCQETLQAVREKERKMFRNVYQKFKETGLGDDTENGTPVSNGGGEEVAAT